MDESRLKEESPVIAYALVTAALLLAAFLMCICLLCCAKCPNLERRRIRRARREKLFKCCREINYHLKQANPEEALSSEACAICLDDFNEKESILLCPCHCKHGYHKVCLGHWLLHTPLCPICKASVIPITETTPLLHNNNT